MFKNEKTKKWIVDYIPLLFAFALIISLGIKEKQTFIKILPAIISLFVVLLSAHVNRISFLIGATNCIFYSIGYFQEGLYGSVASALLFSLPVQVFSFFMWKKNSYKQATMIKTLDRKRLAWLLSLTLLACVVSYFVFSAISSSYVFFESTTFVLGSIASVLIMLGVLEGVIINIVSGCIHLVMWIIIVVSGNLANITYLLLSVYTTYRSLQALYNWLRLQDRKSVV